MDQQPDGLWRWEPGHCRPLCYECESDANLYCYNYNGAAFWFCSEMCASRYAKRMGLDVDHIDRTLSKPYNGAYKGDSHFDMDARECGCGGDYDCCDDAEDYREE